MDEKLRILLCEDDENLGMLLREYLQAKGYSAELYPDGEAGYKAFLKNKYDLCVFDVMMPKKDGFTLAQDVRAANAEIPIIFLTAKTLKEDILEGFKIGADDYITKPFSPSELVARVKAHLNRYQRLVNNQMEVNDIIEIRGLKIDKTARRVYLNGEEKVFTTKEFDLLTFLAGHPNRVFTKEELFNKIWDMESLGDIATVTVHIKKIREKIEVNTAKPQYIETIWGVGYRFKM